MAEKRDPEIIAKDMAEYYIGKKMTAHEINACLTRIKQENLPLHKLLTAELREILKSK